MRWRRFRTRARWVCLLAIGAALSLAAFGCVRSRPPWMPVTVVNESPEKIRCLVIPPSPSTPWDSAVEDDRRYPLVLAPADRATLERDRAFTKGPMYRSSPMMLIVEQGLGRHRFYYLSPADVVNDFPVTVHVRQTDATAESPSGRNVKVMTVADRKMTDELTELFRFQFPSR